MAVPSARPTNRQIKFTTAFTVEWNNGGAFVGGEEIVAILKAIQAMSIDRVDAQVGDGTSIDVQVLINGTPVVWTGSVNVYNATSTTGGLAALNTNTVVADDVISLKCPNAPSGAVSIVRIQVTCTLRDV